MIEEYILRLQEKWDLEGEMTSSWQYLTIIILELKYFGSDKA